MNVNLFTTWIEDAVREMQTLQTELQDVEAKAAVKEIPKGLHKDISAFANRAGGGTIILGVDEAKRFAVVGVQDVRKAQNDLLNYVQNEMSYPVRFETTVVEIDGAPVVAATIMEAPLEQKPVYKKALGLDKGSYHRSGASSVLMTPEQIRQIITSQFELREDFTARLVSAMPPDWYEEAEITRLRNLLRMTRKESGLSSLPTPDLLNKLLLVEPSASRMVPTFAGLLLVGKEEHIRRHVSEHELVFLTHRGQTEEYEQRLDLRCSLLNILETVERRLIDANKIVPLQVGLFRHELPSLHPKVYREALLNALIHRSYQEYGSVFVRIYPDSLKVTNPGGFLPGITPNQILASPPRHRNRRLADAFQLLGLVERCGMGVPKMFRHQIESGKPPPVFSERPAEVVVDIPTELVDPRLAEFVSNQYRQGMDLDVADLLVLSRMRTFRETRSADVATLTHRSLEQSSRHLSAMVHRQLLRKRGTGIGTYYVYSPAVMSALGNPVAEVQNGPIDQVRYPEMVLEFVRRTGRIRNSQVRELCDMTVDRASILLRKMRDEGKLEARGNSPKSTYYVLPKSR